MTPQADNQYVTRTGMKINPRKAFLNVRGAGMVFPTFHVKHYQTVQSVLESGLIDNETRLMRLEVGGEMLTLTLKQMFFHHVAQGELNGEMWAVALCGCCNMATHFSPVVNSEVHHFEGKGVYNGMMMLRDQETGSSWMHITGECVQGPHQGENLEVTNVQMTTAAHIPSDTKIAISKPSLKTRLIDALLINRSFRQMLSGDGFMPAVFRLSMTTKDERLPEMTLGLGVWVGKESRFYSLETIRTNQNALVDTLNGEPIVAFIDSASKTPAAHYTSTAIQGWEDDSLMLDSGERLLNGFVYPADGSEPLPLNRPNQQFTRWFGFSYLFPDCEIYGA